MKVKTIVDSYLVRATFLIFIALFSVACMPRGETISLDESLDLARTRYTKAIIANKSKVPEDVGVKLDTLKVGLDKLAAVQTKESYQQETRNLEESLRPLIAKVGYGSRTAFDEIVKQYAIAGSGDSGEFVAGAPKLLAQRTYHLLAAEVESTKFTL